MASLAPSLSATSYDDIVKGAITALAAQSAFNGHVTCDAEITHFPGQTFKRHTHFVVAHIFHCVDSKPTQDQAWSDGHTVRTNLTRSRTGDLLGKVYLQTSYGRASLSTDLRHPEDVEIATVNNFAMAQVKETRLVVNHNVLEKHSGDIIFAKNELGWDGPGAVSDQMHGTYPESFLGSVQDDVAATINAAESGTGTNGTATTFDLDVLSASAVDDYYVGARLNIAGETVYVTDYVAATRTVTVSPPFVGGPYAAAPYDIEFLPPVNTVPQEARVRISEQSEYCVDLQFHMSHGHDAQDEMQGYFPLVAQQYGDVIVEVDLRAKDQLIKAIDRRDTAAGVVWSPLQVRQNILAGSNANGNFKLTEMHLVAETIFLSAEERLARSKRDEHRIVRYVDKLSATRVQAGEKAVEIKLDSENNTLGFLMFFKRDAADHESARDYFDYSVQRQDGLMPVGLGNEVGSFLYNPRHPLERIKLSVNNNTLVDASAAHLKEVSPLIARFHKVPTQFLYTYMLSARGLTHNEHFGSLADSKIDSLTLRAELARNNAAGDGIASSGTLYVYAFKWTALLTTKGQTGILYPTH